MFDRPNRSKLGNIGAGPGDKWIFIIKAKESLAGRWPVAGVPDRINPIWTRREACGAIADYNCNEGEGGPLNAYHGDAHPT